MKFFRLQFSKICKRYNIFALILLFSFVFMLITQIYIKRLTFEEIYTVKYNYNVSDILKDFMTSVDYRMNAFYYFGDQSDKVKNLLLKFYSGKNIYMDNVTSKYFKNKSFENLKITINDTTDYSIHEGQNLNVFTNISYSVLYFNYHDFVFENTLHDTTLVKENIPVILVLIKPRSNENNIIVYKTNNYLIFKPVDNI